MQSNTLKATKNRADNFSAPIPTMIQWAERYLQEEVNGAKSPLTVKAKSSDLQTFLSWFNENIGHLSIDEWMPRDTIGYIEQLEKEGASPSTVNRRLSSIRSWGRWLLDEPGCPLQFGNPTKGIQTRTIEERAPQALSRVDTNALFRAAEVLTVTETRKNAQPHRNRAILSLLYHTGLRVSELCNLKRDQYTGSHLLNVIRKGKVRARRILVPSKCRAVLDAYLEKESPAGARWLFCGSSPSAHVLPRTAAKILARIAREASKNRETPITIHPHQVRHTFATRHLEQSGSESETAKALGHASLNYVGVYTRATDEQRAEVLESISLQ